MALRAEVRLTYAGPAFLKSTIEKWFPENETIFHRVTVFNYKHCGQEDIRLVAEFNKLHEIGFYQNEPVDTVAYMQHILTSWQMAPIEHQTYRRMTR